MWLAGVQTISIDRALRAAATGAPHLARKTSDYRDYEDGRQSAEGERLYTQGAGRWELFHKRQP
jgi:hypothetical protein